MFRPSMPAIIGLGLLLAAPAMAQEERYQLIETANGIVRLDVETGAISTCTRSETGSLVCRLAADERASLIEEIERLEAENAQLRQGITGRTEDDLAQREQPQEDDWTSYLPSREQVEDAIQTLGQVARDAGESLANAARQLRENWEAAQQNRQEESPSRRG